MMGKLILIANISTSQPGRVRKQAHNKGRFYLKTFITFFHMFDIDSDKLGPAAQTIH